MSGNGQTSTGRSRLNLHRRASAAIRVEYGALTMAQQKNGKPKLPVSSRHAFSCGDNCNFSLRSSASRSEPVARQAAVAPVLAHVPNAAACLPVPQPVARHAAFLDRSTPVLVQPSPALAAVLPPALAPVQSTLQEQAPLRRSVLAQEPERVPVRGQLLAVLPARTRHRSLA